MLKEILEKILGEKKWKNVKLYIKDTHLILEIFYGVKF